MSSNYEDRDRERDYGFEREYERPMPGRGGRRMQRRKICRFCIEKVDLIDFKDVKLLQSYVPERGKILPRRISGVCAAHQRMLAEAIKRARNIALLPYAAD
jgi:small subunit ribosomal protein S18